MESVAFQTSDPVEALSAIDVVATLIILMTSLQFI